jgi:hypothetical protein
MDKRQQLHEPKVARKECPVTTKEEVLIGTR